MLRSVSAALCLTLAACAEDPVGVSDGGNPYALSLVGSARLTLHPGDTRTLSVLLARDQAGPVPSARIHFEFQETGAAATIDSQDVLTDEGGLATVQLVAGASPLAAPLHLVATAPDLGAPPVAFTLEVVAVRRLLQIIGSSTTRVSTDGASAVTVAGVSTSLPLKVRELDADTGEPLAGDVVEFTLPAAAGAKWNGTAAKTVAAGTGPGGDAQAILVTTRAAEGPWQVVARSAAGGSAVTFNVTVQGAGAASCSTNGQCGPGQICTGNPAHCSDDPGAGDPPPSNACDGPACAVAGVWLTRHDFDLRETLPATLQAIFLGFRMLDQTLRGKLTIAGLPRWLQAILDSFLARLLQQYLPDWLQRLIRLSDDAGTLLSHLHSEGSMRLVRAADGVHATGTEVWTSLVFYWLPLCGDEIGGDPLNPPDCARVDLTTTDALDPPGAPQCKGQVLPSISVKAATFTLAVSADGKTLQVDPRQVRVQMHKVLLVLYDALIALVSGGRYQCVEEATDCAGGYCMVDCSGLAWDVDEATSGVIDAWTVEALCDDGVAYAGGVVAAALAGAWPMNAELLEFSGSASIAGRADDAACPGGPCAAKLDGQWSGDFFFRLAHPLAGRWSARRPE